MWTRHYKWWLLLLLGGAYFFHQADRALFGVLLPFIQSDLSLTNRQLGHINTILFLTIAFVTCLAGYVGDRASRKRIITGSLIFWSVATMGLGWASTFTAVLLLRSVATGGGESFYGPSAMSLLASYHRETRSLAFSIHQAALYLGLMLSGVLACWALDLLGTWRAVFVAFGAAGLLLGFLFIVVLKEHETRSAAGRSPKPSCAACLKAFFFNPSALLATTGFVAICCVNNTYLTWAPKMFHDQFGLPGAEAGKHAMFYHHLVAFLAILAGGWVTDRFVRRWPCFRLGFQIIALMCGAVALFSIGTCGTFGAAILMTSVYGLFRGFFEVNTHASVFDVIPAEHRASVVGFMLLLAMGIGAVFSGELMGWVFEHYGNRAYGLVFALMAGTYAVAAVLMSVSFFFTFRRNRIADAK